MNPGDKDTFEQDLQQVEAAYRQSAQDEPPALLDQAILNKARRAIDKPATRPWSFGWIHATATTALVVLGLTLVNQQRDELGNVQGTLDQLQPVAPAPATAESYQPSLQDAAGYGDEAAQEVFGTAEDRRAAVAKVAAESETEQPDAAQVSRQIVSELREADPEAPYSTWLDSSEGKPDPVKIVVPHQAGIMSEEIARHMQYRASPGETSTDSQTGATAQSEPVSAPKAAPAGLDDGKETDEPAQAGADDLRSDNAGPESDELAGAARIRMALPPLGQASLDPAEKKDLDSAKQAQEGGARNELALREQVLNAQLETQVDPEQWLEDIRTLKAADPEGKWRLELQAFREIYPDYAIPDDLLDPAAHTPEPPDPE